MLRLTQESVDDNATVRVITICTLIYLPASFMAVGVIFPHILLSEMHEADCCIKSFLGMNLFDYKESDGSLQASPQFWIFVVTTIPLTMITVGAWYVYKTRVGDKRRRKGEVV